MLPTKGKINVISGFLETWKLFLASMKGLAAVQVCVHGLDALSLEPCLTVFRVTRRDELPGRAIFKGGV